MAGRSAGLTVHVELMTMSGASDTPQAVLSCNSKLSVILPPLQADGDTLKSERATLTLSSSSLRTLAEADPATMQVI